MPAYNLKLTCPVSATHAERTTSTIQAQQGIISQVSVTWSFGSNLLNALVVKSEGGQIIPSEGSGEVRGNGTPVTWPEYIELKKPHPDLTIEVWNEGNDYEQDVFISIVILPAMPDWAKAISDFVDRISRVMGLG